jgi:hypothetical protein
MSINPAARALAETGGTVALVVGRRADVPLAVDDGVGVGPGTADVPTVEDGAVA